MPRFHYRSRSKSYHRQKGSRYEQNKNIRHHDTHRPHQPKIQIQFQKRKQPYSYTNNYHRSHRSRSRYSKQSYSSSSSSRSSYSSSSQSSSSRSSSQKNYKKSSQYNSRFDSRENKYRKKSYSKQRKSYHDRKQHGNRQYSKQRKGDPKKQNNYSTKHQSRFPNPKYPTRKSQQKYQPDKHYNSHYQPRDKQKADRDKYEPKFPKPIHQNMHFPKPPQQNYEERPSVKNKFVEKNYSRADYYNQKKHFEEKRVYKFEEPVVTKTRDKNRDIENKELFEKSESRFIRREPSPIKQQPKLPPKEKVPEFRQILVKAKQNLQIPPLKHNFLILDAYKGMNNIRAQTLDAVFDGKLKQSLSQNYQNQKNQIFAKQIQIKEQRVNPFVKIHQQSTELQKTVNQNLQTLKTNTFALSQMFRQLLLSE